MEEGDPGTGGPTDPCSQHLVGPNPVAAHREPELLFSEIGKLKVELDWLKKKSGISR